MQLFPNGYKGLGDGRHSGVPGSVSKSVGIDPHSTPGLIKVRQKLTKDSGSVIDELCKVGIPVSDGSKLWFSSESGKIWRELSGTYTLVHTLDPATDFNDILPVLGDITRSSGNMYTIFNPNTVKSYAFGALLAPSGSTVPLLTAHGHTNGSSSSSTISFDIVVPTGSNQVVVVFPGNYGGENVSSVTVGGATAGSKTSGGGSSGGFTINFGINRLINPTAGTNTILVTFANPVVDRFVYVAVFDGVDQTTPIPDIDAVFGTTDDIGEVGTLDLPVTADNQVKVGLFVSEAATYTIGENQVEIVNGTTDPAGSAFIETLQYKNLTLGSAPVLDAKEHQSLIDDEAVDLIGFLEGNPKPWIYFANAGVLWRILVDNLASWSGNVETVGPFANGDDTYHPMVVQNLSLYIGDKTVMAEVDSNGVFTAQTLLNIPKTERIISVHDFDTNILIGTKDADFGRVLRWDGVSESWSAQDTVYEEGGVKAFIRDDNYVYAYVGEFGRLYFYNGEKLESYKRIPGEWSPTKKATIYPNSVGFLLGIPIFGLSNLTGDPTEQGVYSFGSYSKDYPKILDLAFPTSSNEFSSLEVGAIVVDGADLYVAWKGASTSGVDKLDYTNKYASAYIETMQLTVPADRSRLKTVAEFLANYVSLPSSTNVTFKVKKKYEASFPSALTGVDDTKLFQIKARASHSEVASLQQRMDFVVSGNNAPEIESFDTKWANEKK